MRRTKKHALTLLEIMIVICLITTIIGVIGYNMKGALDKGKAFRTERAMEQLHDILLYQLAQGSPYDAILKAPAQAVEDSGLAKDARNLVHDGWGVPFEIKAVPGRADFAIRSHRLEKYKSDHHLNPTKESSQDDEDLLE